MIENGNINSKDGNGKDVLQFAQNLIEGTRKL